MFIKVEEDGLYYFGVEADDSGSMTITGDKLCEKKGHRPNGKLNIKTASRSLKAGYYTVALSWTMCIRDSPVAPDSGTGRADGHGLLHVGV